MQNALKRSSVNFSHRSASRRKLGIGAEAEEGEGWRGAGGGGEEAENFVRPVRSL